MSILAVERNQPIVLNVLMVNQIGGLPRTNLSYVDVEVWYVRANEYFLHQKYINPGDFVSAGNGIYRLSINSSETNIPGTSIYVVKGKSTLVPAVRNFVTELVILPNVGQVETLSSLDVAQYHTGVSNLILVNEVGGTPRTGLTSVNLIVELLKSSSTSGASLTSIVGTTITVDNAGIFPTSGFPYNIIIGNGTPSQEIVSVIANDGIFGLTVAVAPINVHTPGELVCMTFTPKTLQLTDIQELGEGIYRLILSAQDTDVLGELLYSVRGVGTLVPQIGNFVGQVLITENPLVPPVSPIVPYCVVTGTILDLSSEPMVNAAVTAKVLAPPTLLANVGISNSLVATVTDTNGYFELPMIQGATVDIIISANGLRRQLVVPAVGTVDLFSIP